jgi:hyperosmotically inducible protein
MIKKFILMFTAIGFFLSSNFMLAGPVAKFGQSIDDSVIMVVINAKYVKNPLLSPFKIDVDTKDGVVTLTGLVDTDLQYEKAITIAQSTNGVNKVIADNLKTKEGKVPADDLMLTAKVKGVLLKHEYLNGGETNLWPVQVEAHNGVVYLSGNVTSKAQKQELIELVKSVDGVKSVKSDIKVKA